MRFTFLGTGTSAGVPAIGCECAVCTSQDPRDRRLRTSAALAFTDPDGAERVILIDPGPDLREQALRARLRRLDAILFTHNHVDHTWGLDEVRRFNAVMKRPIDIYAEPHTLAFLRRVYQHIFDRDANVNDSFVATLVPHSAAPGVPIDLFGVRFTPVRLLHGRLPIVGYRIERSDGETDRSRGDETPSDPANGPDSALHPPSFTRHPSSPFPLAYCTDVSGIPPESWPLLRGVRTLVLDALRHRKHPTHFTLDEALGVAERIGADRTWFVHMAHDLGHAQTDAALPDRVRLAYDGLVLDGANREP